MSKTEEHRAGLWFLADAVPTDTEHIWHSGGEIDQKALMYEAAAYIRELERQLKERRE